MKVRVQGTNDTIVGSGILEDVLVGCGAQPALARMYGIQPSAFNNSTVERGSP
jgi:hypothetical protein